MYVQVGRPAFSRQYVGVQYMHHLDAEKTAGEEARRQLHKNIESNIE